ncbi:MAG: hypothetical protein JWN38_29 [Candidatus Saccharibacteria bacterium]|nr:hypothetical protein [Candidatus Saccharibacteria bacterium]
MLRILAAAVVGERLAKRLVRFGWIIEADVDFRELTSDLLNVILQVAEELGDVDVAALATAVRGRVQREAVLVVVAIRRLAVEGLDEPGMALELLVVGLDLLIAVVVEARVLKVVVDLADERETGFGDEADDAQEDDDDHDDGDDHAYPHLVGRLLVSRCLDRLLYYTLNH